MRARLLAATADAIEQLPRDEIRRVTVDGVDGAGKTHFAGELAEELTGRGVAVVRASVDGFHYPAEIRHRRGRGSADGYFRDAYDYPSMRRLLLDPLSPGGTREYVRAIYDVHQERPVHREPERAERGAVLIVDGIFAHRPELRDYWDYSLWLEVPFTVSIPRGAARGYGDPDPAAPSNRRYIEGQRIYLAECAPHTLATVAVDNSDLANPRWPLSPPARPAGR